MRIKIYQVNTDRDEHHVVFMSYDMLERLQGTDKIDSEIYDCVFEGEVDCKGLERVYRMFNEEHPAGYKGRSLSMSDIVEIIEPETEPKFYYCDFIGFKDVGFEPDMAQPMKEDKIRVLMVEPGKKAYEKVIGNTLDDMYAALDCDCIQAVYPFENVPVAVVCDDEGKLKQSRPNRAIRDSEGRVADIICGKFFVCGCSEQNFKSLPDDMMQKYKKQFLLPERFMCFNGEYLAVKYDPAKEAAR